MKSSQQPHCKSGLTTLNVPVLLQSSSRNTMLVLYIFFTALSFVSAWPHSQQSGTSRLQTDNISLTLRSRGQSLSGARSSSANVAESKIKRATVVSPLNRLKLLIRNEDPEQTIYQLKVQRRYDTLKQLYKLTNCMAMCLAVSPS